GHKFFDFDQFWQEVDSSESGPVIRIFGEDVKLPRDLPAAIPLRALRLQAEGIKQVPPAEVLRLADTLFGRERLDAWLDKGLTITQLTELMRIALEMYASDVDAGDKGKS